MKDSNRIPEQANQSSDETHKADKLTRRRHVVKLCIGKRRDYGTVDLARIGHRQTQQSITDWRMIGFGHYQTVRDIQPKVSRAIKTG